MTPARENEWLAKVREFHTKAGYEYEHSPTLENSKRRDLWRDLVLEESGELLSALEAQDIYAFADGLADTLYVLLGAALAFDIPIEEIFLEVHKSNLTKVSENTEWRQDGKVMRAKTYAAPDVRAIVDRYMKLRTDRTNR